MEKSSRSNQGDGEKETLLWWKWVTSLLVLLSYSLLVAVWIPGKFSDIQATRTVVLDDEALLSALRLSNSLSTLSTTCENFLLAGGGEKQGAADIAEAIPIQGWADGEWYHSRESSGVVHHRRTMGGGVGDRGASFSVNPAPRGWIEPPLSSENAPASAVQPVEGVLELKSFWGWNPSMEPLLSAEAPGAKVDFNQMLAMQNLKVVLKGAFVDTRAGRRLFMTGCAYRVDQSYQIDCGFTLKMTYPSRQATSTTGQVEAELSRRTTRADDPLRFPTVGIQKDVMTGEYTSRITYMPSSMRLNNLNYNAHLRRPSTVDATEFAQFQQDYDDDTYSGYH